eukprot:1869019-Prymnesium_polylepis.1
MGSGAEGARGTWRSATLKRLRRRESRVNWACAEEEEEEEAAGGDGAADGGAGGDAVDGGSDCAGAAELREVAAIVRRLQQGQVAGSVVAEQLGVCERWAAQHVGEDALETSAALGLLSFLRTWEAMGSGAEGARGTWRSATLKRLRRRESR